MSLSKVLEFATKILNDRCPSHGIEHARLVANLACGIAETIDPDTAELAQIVGLLHDVFDHKYDTDGSLRQQTLEFLDGEFGKKIAGKIMLTIDCISYSKENTAIKNGCPIDFVELLGREFALIRDIVSDADKIDAINLPRCSTFTRTEYSKKYGKDISELDLAIAVVKHADEKLMRLKDEFIRTQEGKRFAEEPHLQLMRDVDNARNIINAHNAILADAEK